MREVCDGCRIILSCCIRDGALLTNAFGADMFNAMNKSRANLLIMGLLRKETFLIAFCCIGMIVLLVNVSILEGFALSNKTLSGRLNILGSSTSKYAPEAHVFYHILLTEDMKRTREVVNEQIGYLKNSGIENMLDTIHYTAIGPSSEKFELYPENYKYKKTNASNRQGWEPDTLHLLYNHCKKQPQDVVLYIHTKGVYHNTRSNEIQRQDQTRSLADLACLQSMREVGERTGIWRRIHATGVPSSGDGNVCGMRFSPSPHFHFPGNMWWARCDYVQNLMDPIAFGPKMNKIQNYLYPGLWFVQNPSTLGIGRYAAEHWVCSHPSVRALDLMPAKAGKDGQFFSAGYDLLPSHSGTWDPLPSMMPRSDADVGVYIKSSYFLIMMKHGVYVDSRMKEYSVLYGELALSQEIDGYCRTTSCRLYASMAKRIQIAIDNKEFDPETEEHVHRWLSGWKTGYPRLICPITC